MSHDDYAFEPIRGLPEMLPAGERILWQGAPSWSALWRHVFHARFVAAYFALIIGWRIASGVADGAGVEAIAGQAGLPAVLGLVVLGVLALFAWGYARTTVYTITDRRVVVRSGIAFQVTFNLPFSVVRSAGLRLHRDGSGDIPLTLAGASEIAYLHIWPNVRPWKITNPEPMLRNIAEPRAVAERLVAALETYNTMAAAHAEAVGAGATVFRRSAKQPRVVRHPAAIEAAE
jgi:hypothetical protein